MSTSELKDSRPDPACFSWKMRTCGTSWAVTCTLTFPRAVCPRKLVTLSTTSKTIPGHNSLAGITALVRVSGYCWLRWSCTRLRTVTLGPVWMRKLDHSRRDQGRPPVP